MVLTFPPKPEDQQGMRTDAAQCALTPAAPPPGLSSASTAAADVSRRPSAASPASSSTGPCTAAPAANTGRSTLSVRSTRCS